MDRYTRAPGTHVPGNPRIHARAGLPSIPRLDYLGALGLGEASRVKVARARLSRLVKHWDPQFESR